MKPLLESARMDSVAEISVPPRDLMGSRSVPAADAAALSLVFLLVFCVVCFALGAAVLGRREKRVIHNDTAPAAPEADAAAGQKDGREVAPRQEWERESDWWKKTL
jgi:hypothetical protein